MVKKQTGLILNPKNCIKGYYENTLTRDLQSKMPRAGIVHIDVDLYSSTVEVLEFVKPLLVRGTVLLLMIGIASTLGRVKVKNELLKNFV